MLFKIKSIYLMILFFCLILACSGDKATENLTKNVDSAYWPGFRGDQNLSGVAEDPLPENPELLWSFNTEYYIISSPVIGFGNVYIGSIEGKVYSLDLISGEKVWEFDTGDDIEASPLLLDQNIYIGNLSGVFFAINALSGKVVWKYEIGSEIMGSANWAAIPNSEKKLVFVGSYDTRMYCFDAETGELEWTYETDDFINGAPATDGRHVVFGGCDERLHILSAVDGSKIGDVWAESYIAGSAALVDNRAYLGHYDGKLICIDLIEQKIVWEYEDEETGAEYFSSPAVGKDRVVIGSRDYYLHCVNRETGQRIWKFQTRDDVDSSPVIVRDKVVFGSTDGRLYILNLKDGSLAWSYEIGGAIIASPAVTGGMIVVGAEDGRVYAFGERD